MKCNFALGCLISLSLCGCGWNDSNQATPVPIAKASAVGVPSSDQPEKKVIAEPIEKNIGGMKFEIPSGWEEKTLSNNMILGEFSLPGETGPARLTLSSAGGGTAANMERWKGQFQRGANDPAPQESQITAAGKESTLIEVSGTYSDMFGGGGPKTNWQLVGVAIPIDGQHNYFVKLTGPKETVQARRDEFLKFVQTARLE